MIHTLYILHKSLSFTVQFFKTIWYIGLKFSAILLPVLPLSDNDKHMLISQKM